MKRKKLTKIIVCALVMGAFSFVTILNPFAKEEIFTDSNDYLFMSIDQIDPLGNVEGKSWTYSGADSSTIPYYFYSTTYPDLKYFPCYIQGWEGWVSSSDSDLSEGILRLAKFFGDDTGNLLSEDIIISRITVVCVVGFQSGFTVILPEVPNFDSSVLRFNGEFLTSDQYSLVRRRTAVSPYNMPDFPYYSFDIQQYSFEYTFNTPLVVSSSDNADFGHTAIFDWSGYGFDGFNVLFGHSGFLVEYSTITDYENGIIGNNNMLVGDLKNEVDDLINDMHVPTVDDSTIDDILGSVDNSSVEDVAGLANVFDNDLLSFEMSEFLSLILIASLGIAFTGYALHGKRG